MEGSNIEVFFHPFGFDGGNRVEMAKPNYLERIKLEKEEEEKEKNQALMADQQEITSNVFILFLFYL